MGDPVSLVQRLYFRIQFLLLSQQQGLHNGSLFYRKYPRQPVMQYQAETIQLFPQNTIVLPHCQNPHFPHSAADAFSLIVGPCIKFSGVSGNIKV